jgi:hypothetical protein
VSAKLVILSCTGTLMVVFNKPFGEAFKWLTVELYGRNGDDYSAWNYRAPLILFGLLLTCMSFLVYE